jgi:hypothetical protein
MLELSFRDALNLATKLGQVTEGIDVEQAEALEETSKHNPHRRFARLSDKSPKKGHWSDGRKSYHNDKAKKWACSGSEEEEICHGIAKENEGRIKRVRKWLGKKSYQKDYVKGSVSGKYIKGWRSGNRKTDLELNGGGGKKKGKIKTTKKGGKVNSKASDASSKSKKAKTSFKVFGKNKPGWVSGNKPKKTEFDVMGTKKPGWVGQEKNMLKPSDTMFPAGSTKAPKFGKRK